MKSKIKANQLLSMDECKQFVGGNVEPSDDLSNIRGGWRSYGGGSGPGPTERAQGQPWVNWNNGYTKPPVLVVNGVNTHATLC